MPMTTSPAMTTLYGLVATSAIHDGKRDEEDYTHVCHPGTREAYLENLMKWAEEVSADKRVQWANAIAGAGKTATLRTFCTELEAQGRFPSFSFFAWRTDARRNTLERFPATIAAQLCRRISALVTYVERAINEDCFLLQSVFKKQMEKLVICPLLDARDAVKSERHLIIVVDGLDELDASGQSEFLSFIPYLLSRLSSLPISLLVSSRPEAMIVGAFHHPRLASITISTRLGASDEDIRKFLDDKFDDINLRFPFLEQEHGGKWPSQKKREIMVILSSGLFIWPTVAIRYIDKVEKGLGHNERLEQVLSTAEPKPWAYSPLDNLYRAILQAHAPEDRKSAEFFRFKRRLALLCLPVELGMFVFNFDSQVIDWTDTLVRTVFEETVDEVWRSVAGMTSLFSPRTPLSSGKPTTPLISHRSLRDFTFNRTRCGDEFYYSNEKDLHTEVVCKIFKLFNTQQVYQSCAEMSGRFIEHTGRCLKSHSKAASISEELGRCMDGITMESIPHIWPLVTQLYMIRTLFDGLYSLAGNPDFPDGTRRQEALLFKVMMFFKTRIVAAQQWDTALLRLALSTTDLQDHYTRYHSVHCWHVAQSSRCTCIHAYLRNLRLRYYRGSLFDSILTQHVSSRLVVNWQDGVAQDSLDVLKFIIPLSETGQRSAELSPFITVRIDYWILLLLGRCPPDRDLYNILGHVCTAPLPNLPKRAEDRSHDLVGQFLEQASIFHKYEERCREAGIETNFAPIEIPEGWWLDPGTKDVLVAFGYKPPPASVSIFHPAAPTTTVPGSGLQLSGFGGDVPTHIMRRSSQGSIHSQRASVVLESAVVLDAPASDVEDFQQGTLAIVIPSQPAHATLVSHSAPAEQTVVSGTNRAVSTTAGVQDGADQRRRGSSRSVRGFLKRLVCLR